MTIVVLSIVIPLAALVIGLSIQQLSLEADDNALLYWGDKICLIMIGATVSLSFFLYQKFIVLDIDGFNQGSLFLVFLIPFLEVIVHFIFLVRSAIAHQKKGRTGRANFIGILSLVVHFAFVIVVFSLIN